MPVYHEDRRPHEPFGDHGRVRWAFRAIVGAGEKADEIADGDLLLIDGAAGEVVAQPDEQTLADFAERQKQMRRIVPCSRSTRIRRGATSDGRRVIIEGNIGTPDDAVA